MAEGISAKPKEHVMVALPAVVDGVPFGSDGKPLKPHQQWDDGEGCPIGRDPRQMSVAELAAIGVHARPVLKAIRANCVDCMGGSEAEVRRCGQIACPMWAFRMGTNPFRAPPSDEQRQAAAQRLRGSNIHLRRKGQTPDGLSPVSDIGGDAQAAGNETLDGEIDA